MGRVPAEPVQVPVWDRFVRVFHWSLVASFATAWLSTEHIGGWHKGAGYLALALVLARIVWGFVAPGEHARFGSFVPTPRRLRRYLGQLLLRQEQRHLGHNPAGAVMIIYLLAANLVIGATGIMMTSDAFWGDDLVETVHTGTVNLTLLAVAVHVAANLYGSWRHGEHLVRSMWTGRKPLSTVGRRTMATDLPATTGDRQCAGRGR